MAELSRLQYSTPLHDLFYRGASTNTSHHFFRSCIGWESSSGSSSSSQYSSSAAWTAWLRRTYPVIYYVCQTWRLIDVCVRRQRRRSSSRRDVSTAGDRAFSVA